MEEQKQSLVEKAKSIKSNTEQKISDEEIDLALAWMVGEITGQQMTKVFVESRGLSAGNSSVHSRVGVILREAYRRGRLSVINNRRTP